MSNNPDIIKLLISNNESRIANMSESECQINTQLQLVFDDIIKVVDIIKTKFDPNELTEPLRNEVDSYFSNYLENVNLKYFIEFESEDNSRLIYVANRLTKYSVLTKSILIVTSTDLLFRY